MKQIFKLFILLLVLTIALAGCSGGGGGGTGGGGTPTVTFVKTIDNGTLAGSTSLMSSSNSSSRWQNLYRSSNIAGSGNIISISFQYSAAMAAAVSCPNTTIKLSHSNLTNLTDTFANNLLTGQGGQTTVLSNSTMVFPAGAAGSWHTITFATPFNYNGVDNLIADFALTSPCTGVVYDDVQSPAPYTATAWTFTGAAVGSTNTFLQDMKFHFAGGDNVAVGLNGAGSNEIPFSTSTNWQKAQLLYTADEINGSGIINGIAFPAGIVTNAGTYTVNIRMGHTTLTELTNNFANNFNSGSPVTVASSVNFSIPAGVPIDSYIWIPMPDATFNYNGTDNLVVEIAVTSASTSNELKMNNTFVTKRRLYAAVADPTGDLDGSYYCIKFRFAGGPVDVITNASNSDVYPFRDDSGSGGSIRQILYLASELGAKGTITKVAHRLSNDPSATASYGSFTVKIMNTDITALGTNFSTNMPSGTTVFTGTYLILGTLKAGDWIEIPLSTPFVIDPTKNLIVQMSNHSGSLNTLNRIDLDNTRYSNRRVYADGDTNTVGFQSNHLADLFLIMQ